MISRIRRILIVAHGAGVELRRRRDPAVLGLFAILLLGFLAVARAVGFENPATGTFVLNLSLTVVVGLAQVVSLVTAARLMPDEFDRRTIYPLLARPIHRSDILLGKWLTAVVTGIVLLVGLGVPTWLLIPRMESYHPGTLLQFALLLPGAIAVTAAGGLAATLLLPRLPGIFAAVAILFGTGPLLRVASGFYPLYMLPAPDRLNLVLRYTDGMPPLASGSFVLLLLYAALWTLLLLTAAAQVFERRSV